MSLDMRKSGSSLGLAPGFGGELAQLASVAGLAIPALGIVVVDPLMSLLDTACIGRTSSTQLAALAPNSAVFNMIFQVRPSLRPLFW
jgi:Na+-driven multidrug efflux pump